MLKVCIHCLREKPADTEHFYAHKKTRDGLYPYCKACNNVKKKRWNRENPDRARASARKGDLKLKYGMTLEDYDAMLEAHGGVCAICGGVDPDGRNLAVDHDPDCCPGRKSCGRCVRGLLCAECNTGIGKLGHDAGRLQSAIEYLSRY